MQLPKPQMIAGIVVGIAVVVLIYFFAGRADFSSSNTEATVEAPAE